MNKKGYFAYFIKFGIPILTFLILFWALKNGGVNPSLSAILSIGAGFGVLKITLKV